MQTDTNGEIPREEEPGGASVPPADDAEVPQSVSAPGESAETGEISENQETAEDAVSPENLEDAEVPAEAASSAPAPAPDQEALPAPSEPSGSSGLPDSPESSDSPDEPPLDDNPDHSEIRTRNLELEDETGGDLQPESGDPAAGLTPAGTEAEDEEFAAITKLEYLPSSKKEGEEEENLPRFSSVAEARAVLEGFLFTTNEPLSVQRLSKLCGNLHPRIVRGLVLELQMEYDGRPGGLQIVEVAGGFQMATRPHIAEWMFRLHKHRKKSALSPATLETLAIIAYKQPITKGEIEAIRGVESSGTIRTLQDLNLIDVGGRREVPGRPQLYVTTPQFLKAFGLNSLADLPSIAELRHRFADEQKLRAPLPAPVRPAQPPTEEKKPAAVPGESAVPEEEGAGEPTPDEAMEAPAAEEEPDAPPAENGTPEETAEVSDGDEIAAPFSEEEVAEAMEEARSGGPRPGSEPANPDEEEEDLEQEDDGGESEEDEDEEEDFDDEDFEDDDDFEDEEVLEDEEEDEAESPADEEPVDEAAEETPIRPEDEIPPPSSVPLGRVPKPPRKGGWGIGRPLMMDDEDG